MTPCPVAVQALQQVIKGCLKVDPAARITLKEVEQQLLKIGQTLEQQRQQSAQP